MRPYNQIIGLASSDINAGDHVHVHNLEMASFERDYAFCKNAKPTAYEPEPRTFMGIKRADGRIVTRNYIVSAKVPTYFYSHQGHEYYLLNYDEENLMAASTKLATHWQPHIEAWQSSGKSQAAYCREHNLVKSRFSYWKHKLRPAEPGLLNRPGSSFVPVRVMGDSNPGLKLQLPNGVSIAGICADNLGLAQQLASTWL